MINILNAKSTPLEERFRDFDPNFQTYIVADIQTKALVQKHLLETHPCLPEDSVLRMSEWLKKLLYRNGHEVEMASPALVTAMLSEWLKGQDNKISKYPGSPQLLLHYIGEFLPILQSDESVERVREWLRENPNVLLRWGFWFEQSVVAWQFFKSQNIIAFKWLGGFFSGQSQIEGWDRELFVDVGPDLAGVEVDLLSRFAEQIAITIYSPNAQTIEKYKETLWPYKLLFERIEKQKIPTDSGTTAVEEKAVFSKFTTQIAEVKAATSRVREWLEQGVVASEIGIIAADIEGYWPTLREYLSVEGVPVQKDQVVTAIMMPKTARWFSRMRMELQSVDSSHLETVVFRNDSEPKLDFEKFKQLFSKIYDFEDLDRDSRVSQLFELKIKPNQNVGRDEFASWALRYTDGEIDILEPILTQLLLECPSQTVLEARSWLDYLAQVAVNVEIPLVRADAGGIICQNLSAARSMPFQKVIVLGLSEKKLSIQSQTNISAGDVQKLNQDLGIYLNSPNRRYFEFLVESQMGKQARESEYYFSATNFRGDPEAPSRIWLEQAMARGTDVQAIAVPGPTRWDEIQKNLLDEKTKAWVDQDLRADRDKVTFSSDNIQYSVSQIEKYLQCPFVFLAEKVFHLSELPDVDLDLDAMTSGRIMHAILEKIVSEPFSAEIQPAEIDSLIDDIQTRLGLPFGNRALWQAQKKIYVAMTLRFLAFETKWRQDFPATKTVAKEMRVKGDLEITPQRKIRFAGQIDRVDTNRNSNGENEYVIIDYKSSGSSLRNHGSWLNQNELQLLFYSHIVDEGLSDLPKGHVIGAFYFALKSMDREKGMRLTSHDGALYSLTPKSKSHIEQSDLNELRKQMNKMILRVVESVEEGQFSPIPSDVKDCDRCNWRTVCRAAHLN